MNEVEKYNRKNWSNSLLQLLEIPLAESIFIVWAQVLSSLGIIELAITMLDKGAPYHGASLRKQSTHLPPFELHIPTILIHKTCQNIMT